MKFERVKKYKDSKNIDPKRQTANSAGYDLFAAEDIVIPPYFSQMDTFAKDLFNNGIVSPKTVLTLEDMANFTKQTSVRPTLVSTGVKCKLDPGTYLQLSVRSSTPYKYWLILGNGVGIIDADYYNNPSNEGEIFLQIINLSPCHIKIKKGEAIGQGIIKPYLTTENDVACGQREGGFGSTTK